MKVAICLYGQPRDYKLGFKNINNFIKKNSHIHFNFFFHAWVTNTIFQTSPWRKINQDTLIIKNKNDVMIDLLNIYKPIRYVFENSIDNFDISFLSNTIAYNNTLIAREKRKKFNINNTFSQIYSRSKVRNILFNYVNKNKVNYDMVITLRLDYQTPIDFLFNKINTNDKNLVYVSNVNLPRKSIPDNFIVCSSLDIFFKWFNLYPNLKNIINNKKLEKIINNLGEKLEINMEEIILANYLLYFDIKNVRYSNMIKSAF